MNDYSKWDKIVDSDEEREKEDLAQKLVNEAREDTTEKVRDEQLMVEQWLRRNLSVLLKSEDDAKYGKRDPYAAPELIQKSQLPFRKPNKEDMKVLAMLMVLSHFEEGQTNLVRHGQILDLCRHHRWLEEDPGALEFLCRLHNLNMKQSDDKGRPPPGSQETKIDGRCRSMCLCAINTLAGPAKAKCAGGVLELFNLICTPSDPNGHELRLKWQKKEFGKDALFDSLFPDLKSYKDEHDNSDNDWWEIWLMLGFIVVIIVGLGCVMYYGFPNSSKQAKTTTTTTITTLAAAATSAVEAVTEAVGKAEL